jgi:hypothetical protein
MREISVGDMMRSRKRIEGFLGGTDFSEISIFISRYKCYFEKYGRGQKSISISDAMKG